MSHRKLKDPYAQARLERDRRERERKRKSRESKGHPQRGRLSRIPMVLVPADESDTRMRRGRPRRFKWVARVSA